MRIAVTGATGFLGRYLVAELVGQGHHCRCWYRMTSDRSGFSVPQDAITWVPGDLGDPESAQDLLQGCDAVVHAALFRPSGRFIGGEGDILPFVEKNIVGTIRLIEAARRRGSRDSSSSPPAPCTTRSSMTVPSTRPIPSGRPATTAPTRRRSRRSSTAMASATVSRSVRCVRPGSTAWPIRLRRASGSTWSLRSRVGRTSSAAAAARKSTPPTLPAPRPCS